MNVKKLIVLFVLLIGMGAFYFWDQKKIEEKKQVEDQSKELFTWKLDDVNAVTIKTPTQTTALKKAESGWQIVSPVDAEADQDAVKRMLESLEKGKIDRVVREESGEVTVFGLNPPAFLVTFEDTQGKNLGALKIGEEIATKSYFYAQVNDSSKVITVAADLKTAVDKPPSDLRDKIVFHVTQEKIRSVEFGYPDAPKMVASGTAEKQWKITSPFEAVADWEDVSSFQSKIKLLKVKDFVEEDPADIAQYGIILDATRVVVSEQDRAEPISLFIGNFDNEKNAYYAKLSGKTNVFTIETPFVKAIPKTPLEWRPDRPVPLWDYQATVAKIEQPGVGVLLDLSKDATKNWVLNVPQPPAGAGLETNKISEFLKALHEYKIDDYVSEAVDSEKTGLAAPTYIISVSGEDRIGEFVLGKETEDGKIYGKRKMDNEVFVGSNSILQQLKTNFNEFIKAPPAPGEATQEIDLGTAEQAVPGLMPEPISAAKEPPQK